MLKSLKKVIPHFFLVNYRGFERWLVSFRTGIFMKKKEIEKTWIWVSASQKIVADYP